MNLKTNVKGITLIALVVTIIVLLILAGVAINLTIGNKGIFQKAQGAANTWRNAETNEQIAMDSMGTLLEEYTTGITIEQVDDQNPGLLEGIGTDTDPYVINSIEDLVVFAYNVREGNTYEGETVVLGLSLDFKSNKSYVDPFRTDYGKYGYDGELKTLLTSGEGFIPIGKFDVQEEKNEDVISQNNFEGIFDGDDNIIRNLYINEVEENDKEQIGLFANNCGEIKNLGLDSINIYVKGKTIPIGGIAGATFGNIIGCHVTGKIKCDVTLWSMVGGITGEARKSLQITECSNRANVICNNLGENGQATAGGIVGGIDEYIEINKCYNSGYIYGYSENKQTSVGGITTGMQSGKIINCYNTGKIEGKGNSTTYIGGIIGNSGTNNDIYNCFNTGEIVLDRKGANGQAYIGGIIGQNYNTTLTNVYNVGNVKIQGNNTNIRVGGLAAGYGRRKNL